MRMLKSLGWGAAAGVLGSVLMDGLMRTNQKWAPSTLPPIRQDPGYFMLQMAKTLLPSRARRRLPAALETAVAKGLAVGYGTTAAVIYAGLRCTPKNVWLDGALLGLGTWAAGYLGWLPATRLMPPVHRQSPAQALLPVATHVLFGVFTVGAYRWLSSR